MTLRTIHFIALLLITLSFNSCQKKDSNNGCDIGGGITIPNSYRFWTALPMYNTAIQVKDENGSLMPPYNGLTKIYYIKSSPNWEPDACTYDDNNEAVYGLRHNTRYTYKAVNGSQTWTGVINVPCEQGKCFNIEIK